MKEYFKKEYNEFSLGEFFNKIDDTLQKYFGEEDMYSFYEREDEDYKVDLVKEDILCIYLMVIVLRLKF